MVLLVEQAAKRGLADFVALTEQTIAVTTIKQTDYLQQQNGKRDEGQLSFDFCEYHFIDFQQILENIKQIIGKCKP